MKVGLFTICIGAVLVAASAYVIEQFEQLDDKPTHLLHADDNAEDEGHDDASPLLQIIRGDTGVTQTRQEVKKRLHQANKLLPAHVRQFRYHLLKPYEDAAMDFLRTLPKHHWNTTWSSLSNRFSNFVHKLSSESQQLLNQHHSVRRGETLADDLLAKIRHIARYVADSEWNLPHGDFEQHVQAVADYLSQFHPDDEYMTSGSLPHDQDPIISSSSSAESTSIENGGLQRIISHVIRLILERIHDDMHQQQPPLSQTKTSTTSDTSDTSDTSQWEKLPPIW